MDATDVLLLVVRAALAVTLLAAGASKLADVAAFRSTLTTLGVASRAAHPAATAIAAAEILVGSLSIARMWPRAVDVAVVVATASFAVVSLLGLVRASATPCRCFGALTRSQFDARALARNCVLTALAVAVAWSGRGIHVESNPVLPAIATTAAALVVALGWHQAARALAVVQRSRTI